MVKVVVEAQGVTANLEKELSKLDIERRLTKKTFCFVKIVVDKRRGGYPSPGDLTGHQHSTS